MHCQLVRRRYETLRMPRGSEPFFEFNLAVNEHFVGIANSWQIDRPWRKTVDHFVEVWVRCEFASAFGAGKAVRA